ncbi:hypothetical protein F53441_859 [Fusarium austroafricanum]|uniref:Pentacotripeptide-repeat region of PRORP domain-containing protein n=1 Tax=Fusarium austroafricanum TaxID=2364996 RepID=A0A8H4P5R5_9HYPO|nr:hypothetical protein F53441_859 [Fusarium austroafricanum]
MLERTAATLESRSLQRAIHKTSNRSRRLHTGFWQHGASAIDLSSSLSGLTRTAETAASESEVKQLKSKLLASVLVLDFLYPTSTIPLLRRLYPELPNSQQAQRTVIVPRRRAYSSTTPPTSTEETPLDRPSPSTDSSRPYEIAELAESPNLRPDMDIESKDRDTSAQGRFQDLLNGKGRHFQDVWDQYDVMDNDQRAAIRGKVVQYLSRSHNIVETGRALSVFRQMRPEEWDNETLRAGIILLLRSGDLQSAVECFKTGLEIGGLTLGLEYIMADTINSRKWSAALDVWTSYYKNRCTRYPDKTNPSLERLHQIGSVPSQGDHYFSFRAFLVGEGAEQYKEAKKDPIVSKALTTFRRFFASMALREPCNPQQAIVILEALRSNDAYNLYFNTMFNRWYDKIESRATIEQLPAIYQKFRELPDAQPAMSVYRGMFKVNFPKNTARLEELKHDWIRFKGALNQWGYEKYLRYYALRGDVAEVRKLWAQYVKEYPEVLQSPRAFRSTMNVYAQIGDIENTKKELDKMVNEYNVQPDVDSWNVILKAYMRTNDYGGVMDLFDEIASQHQPDSFTYAHAMAMCAKKGDLETTLEFFTKSQQSDVPVTKEMGLALIVAYCQNGLLTEAESICIEMAHRKLASGAIWNQLINFNGVEGKISKVYELLRRMRESGVEWDDETYGFLLQALVRVNQIHPAYTLLKRGVEGNLFLVTPEHFAIVMAGAARVGEFELVESLYNRLQKSELPVTFSVLVAVVGSAVRVKPGVDRTKNLGKEFVKYLQQAAATSKDAVIPAADGTLGLGDTSNLAGLRAQTDKIGRAIALLVELRDFGSIEELMGLFVQIFPEFQSEQFPPDIMSALMRAHHEDQNYDKVIKLWEKTWQSAYAASRKRSGDGILAGTEYDLSRALDVVAGTYKEMNDPEGLSKTVDNVTEAGFKLTRQNWIRIVRDLSDLGKWERAMYWCEKLLMPGWEGWAPQRDIPRLRLNTRTLKAPNGLILRLQQKWMEMRKVAAWSIDVSRILSTVEERYPRLYHAFTTSEVESMPSRYIVNGKEVSAGDLDKVLQNLSYHTLLKVKETMLRELGREKKRETSLGIKPDSRDMLDKKWKEMLHDRVRRYAAMWYSQRKKNFRENQVLQIGDLSGDIKIEAKNMTSESPDDRVARERFAYWNKFWDRYDQKNHGALKVKKQRYSIKNHHGANTWGRGRHHKINQGREVNWRKESERDV